MMLNARRVLVLLLAVVFMIGWGLVSLPEEALGFTLDDALTNGTPDDPSDDLLDAARWSDVPGSLVEEGVRGLGGGLEYSIASDFCTRLIPRFIDFPKPSCDELREAIRRAFDRWAAGHPVLTFTDVSARINPMLPPVGHSRPWEGFGAEIDLFALSPAEYPKVRNLGAYTSFWYLYADPLGTNGRELPGNTLTSADIVFNTSVCYHLSPALAGRGCNHFESLVLHEIGHALALDHPNEFPHRNFDTDNDPTNEIPIDCVDPTKGLKLSAKIDSNAVMNSSLGRPQPVRLELTNDDLGGRNFLYPICEEAEEPTTYTLTVEASCSNAEITVTPPGQTVPGQPPSTFHYGHMEEIRLYASPTLPSCGGDPRPHRFKEWRMDGLAAVNPLTFKITGDTRAVAYYEPETAGLPPLLDHTMAKGVQTSYPYDPINPTYTFSHFDERALSWLKFGPVYQAHRVEWKWYSPDGKLYWSYTNTIPDPKEEGKEFWEWYKIWCWINIWGYDAAEMPGNWRVDIYLDGQKILTERFTIR